MLLTTERLLLREFIENDWHAVFAYQSDSRYLQYSPWTHRRREHVERLVQECIRWQSEQPRYKFQLAILLQTNHQLIGSCGIRMATAHAPEAELGYELHPDHWGQGYATEAARHMLAFAFQTLHLQRVWAQCVAENTASMRVLERLGMRYKQRLPQHTVMQNRWWDMLEYAMDRAEWQAQTETEG
jgi:[ribosomal protein S5]-alanine N-acetyltransferase